MKEKPPLITDIFCDGGLIPDPDAPRNKKNPSAIGGTWAYCHVAYDLSGRQYIVTADSGALLTENQMMHWYPKFRYLPGYDAIENNIMELTAAIHAVRAAGEGWNGTLWTDNANVAGWLYGYLKDGKLTYFSLENVHPRLAMLTQELRVRLYLNQSHVVLVAGHPTQKDLAAGETVDGEPVSPFNEFCDRQCKMLSQSYLALYGKTIPTPPSS